VIILATGDPDGMTKISYLRKPQVDGEKQACPDEQYHEPGIPSEIPVKLYKEIVESVHVCELNG
jgi:hypothetical protein